MTRPTLADLLAGLTHATRLVTADGRLPIAADEPTAVTATCCRCGRPHTDPIAESADCCDCCLVTIDDADPTKLHDRAY